MHLTAATYAGVLVDVELNQTITEACRAAVGSMVRAVTGNSDLAGRSPRSLWLVLALLERFAMSAPAPG